MMLNARQTVDQHILEMRWRCLSLAADLDRIERASDGPTTLQADARIEQLRQALRALLDSSGNRAERVQLIFTDHTPAPPYAAASR